jgi:ankyrin repeat-rich membrane spanning protein
MHKGLVVLVACSCMVAGSLWGIEKKKGPSEEEVLWFKAAAGTGTEPYMYLYYWAADNKALERKNDEGETALIVAARQGYRRGVDLLLSNWADVDTQDAEGKTALMYAAENGYVDIVSKLLENGANVRIATPKGETAVRLAPSSRRDVIDLLQKALSKKDSQEELWFRAAKKGYVKTIQALRAELLNVDAVDPSYGATALIYAARKGHVDVVKDLIGARAKVDVQDENGETALMKAVRSGYVEIVKDLLEAGANKGLTNNEGKKVFDLVVYNGDIQGLLYPEVKKTWFKSVNDGDLAAIQSAIDAYSWLINLQDDNGMTALMWAAKNRNKDIIAALLENFLIDKNLRNAHGKTALDYAEEVKADDEKVIQLLRQEDTEKGSKRPSRRKVPVHRQPRKK